VPTREQVRRLPEHGLGDYIAATALGIVFQYFAIAGFCTAWP
jgi:hypothetical protein